MATRLINGREHKFQDLAGRRFGRLVVLSLSDKNAAGGRTLWNCLCDCGAERVKPAKGLKCGDVKSCGHRCPLWFAKKHNGCRRPEYNVWSSMKRRCTNPSANDYARYGGRGIKVCERWMQSFADFFEDMGSRPSPTHQIDRIDNDGNYEPGNCRWATPTQQGRNKRNNRLITVAGETCTLAEWGERTGVITDTLADRAKRRGTPIEDEISRAIGGDRDQTRETPEAIVREILDATLVGESVRSISRRLNLPRTTVQYIVMRKRRANV